MMEPSESRRSFLRLGAGSAASLAALNMFPPAIRKALAIPANNRTGTIADVEHVVILMQENRSFDNYFGAMPGVRGFADRFPIPVEGGGTVLAQKNAAGTTMLPYHLDQSKGNAQRVKGTPHSWTDARQAWNKGRMNEWPRYKESHSMGYFKEQEVPFQYALAQAFTICDGYFCSLHGGTNTNRMFHWTGTNGASVGAQVVVNNTRDDIGLTDTEGFDWTTYPERLEQAGVRWMVYQNMPDNFTDNPLVGFTQYRQANLRSGKPVSHSVANNPAYDRASDDAGNPLYKGIANTMPDGGLLASFKADIQAGQLAQVSWVIAPAEYSEHPGPSSPTQGAWYIQEVLDALTANPEVWSKTVLLINFDENDGFFDHYPPPCAPSLSGLSLDGMVGKTTLAPEALSSEYYIHEAATPNMPARDGDCYGPGPRVPMYVISPWSRGGWVNSQHFDHTSVLRFLEARFGVQETNISAYRRAVFGDLTTAFNFQTPNDELPAVLNGRQTKAQADQLRQAQAAQSQVAVPNPQPWPEQAAGILSSRALPYELHTSARTNVQERSVQLLFSNTGEQAAVFHVYDRLHLDRIPKRYMLEPQRLLDDQWFAADDAGRYDLWVLGPNGYHRHFVGDLSESVRRGLPDLEVRVCYDVRNGNVYATLMNSGTASATCELVANAYFSQTPTVVQVAPQTAENLHWDLKDSGRWYDFSLSCRELPQFQRRFAGRVETGQHSISDPAMGVQP